MLALKIAFRYLKAKKSHKAVNVITLIAVIGVAIASAAMVLVLCIFNGFADLAASQLSSLDPDLSIVDANDNIILEGDSLVEEIIGIAGVQSALPIVSDKGLLVDGVNHVPIIFKGVPSGYDKATGIDKIIIAGEYAETTVDSLPVVQLGVGVANQIHTTPSPESHLQLYVPRKHGRINPANPSAAFRVEDVLFSGVFRVSNSEIDGDHILIPIDVAKDLMDYDTEATAIEVKVNSGTSIEDVKKDIQEKKGDKYRVLTRLEQRADSFKMISIEKWVTFMMLVCILIIALFNVVSTLSLLAIEKRDNMWTLKSLGATASTIRNVFIAEGFLVTTLGGAIGIVIGVIVALVQQYFHIVGLSADTSALTIDYYPVRLEVTDLFIIAAVIILLALIVSGVARLIVRSKRSI